MTEQDFTLTAGQQAFLDLSGGDPSKAFAEALINACGERGPIFVYNAGFETARIRDLAVVSQDVVPVEAESGGGRFVRNSGMRPAEVVVLHPGLQFSSSHV